MAFSNGWRGPDIVADGLFYYIDPGSPNSYRGLYPSTLFNMGGTGGSTAFINGAAYSSNNDGTVFLDGTNDYLQVPAFSFPDNSGQLSLSFWVNFLTTPTGLSTILGDGAQSQTVGYLWIYVDSISTVTYQYATAFGRSTVDINGFMTGRYNTWVNICFVVDYTLATFVGYRNGVAVRTQGLLTSPSFPSTSRTRFIGSYSGLSNFANMYVGPFMMYSKTLSASEVLQNYNATKTRFGL